MKKEKLLVFCPPYSFFGLYENERFRYTPVGTDIVVNEVDTDRYDVTYIDYDRAIVKEHGLYQRYFNNHKSFLPVLKSIADEINSTNYDTVFCSIHAGSSGAFDQLMIVIATYICQSLKAECFVGGYATTTIYNVGKIERDRMEKEYPRLSDVFDEMNWPVTPNDLSYMPPSPHTNRDVVPISFWNRFNKTFVKADSQYPRTTVTLVKTFDNLVDFKIRYGEIFRGFRTNVHHGYEDRYILQACLKLSEGCPNNCSFCEQTGQPFDRFSTERSKEIIQSYIDRGFNSFFLLDRSANAHSDKLYEWLADKHPNVRWSNSFNLGPKYDYDYWSMIYDAGCRIIDVGCESVSDNMLKIINKKITSTEMQDSMDAAHKAGLMINANFIFGMPGETIEDIKQTFAFMLRNKDKITSYALNSYVLKERSDFYVNAKSYGINLMTGGQFHDKNGHAVQYTVDTGFTVGLSASQLNIYKQRLNQELNLLLCNTVKPYSVSQHLIFALFDIFDNKTDVTNWLDKHIFHHDLAAN